MAYRHSPLPIIRKKWVRNRAAAPRLSLRIPNLLLEAARYTQTRYWGSQTLKPLIARVTINMQ